MITPHGNLGEFIAGHVVGVVAAVPPRVVTNDGWPAAAEAGKMTGVQTRRHVGDGETTESLCLEAAFRLMANLGWARDSVDALVYVTQTPTFPVPSPAFQMHRELGLSKHAPALEVNWSCAGYVYGLWLAMKLAAVDTLHDSKRVLLLVGDTSSRICDAGDRATAPLFGDAGSATAIESGPLSGLSYFVLGNDGIGVPRLHQPAGEDLRMDGGAVFNFTLQTVPGLVADVLENGKPDWLLFHQANRFMLQHLVKKMGLLADFDPAQIPVNVEEFGNTSCASIPLLLCDKVGAIGAARTKVGAFGYGAGWAWGGAWLDMHGLQCAELLAL